MTRWIAGAWFVSAYSPLLLLLAIKEFALGQRWLPLALLAAAAVSGFFSWAALQDRFTPSSSSFPVRRVDAADIGLGVYMTTFVLPFIAVTGATATDILVLVLFFALVGLLLVHSRTLLPNLVLILLRYRWRLVTLDDGDQRQVLVPPGYPLDLHTNPPVRVGAGNGPIRPKFEMCQLAEGIWLAKEMR
jgi:hypothetical protein